MQIGERLKEAREARNLSLEELQEMTKIQKRYLQAIEEGNLQILPGKFYARAFMKEYANAVGLDPDELLEEHKEEVPKTEEPSEEQYSRIQRSRKSQAEKSSSNFSLFPTIIVVLLIIGIIAVAIFFISQNMSGTGSEEPVKNGNSSNDIIIKDDNEDNEAAANENADDSEKSDEQDKADDKDKDKDKEAEFNVVEKGTGSTPESTVEFTYTGEEITAKLEATGDTWLGVRADNGEELFAENMFNQDQSPLEIDLSGKERVFFKIGNASVLTITINGVEMEYPVDASNVRQNIWIELKQETE